MKTLGTLFGRGENHRRIRRYGVVGAVGVLLGAVVWASGWLAPGDDPQPSTQANASLSAQAAPGLQKANLPIEKVTSPAGSSFTVTLVQDGVSPGGLCAIKTLPTGQTAFVPPLTEEGCRVRVAWSMTPADYDANAFIRRGYGFMSQDKLFASGMPSTGSYEELLVPLGVETDVRWRYDYGLRKPASKGTSTALLSLNLVVAETENDNEVSGGNFPTVNCQNDMLAAGSGVGAPPVGFLPGRWHSLVPNANPVLGLMWDPGVSYDIETRPARRNAAGVITRPRQLRATLYTFDHTHAPVWLQTQWMTFKPTDPVAFKGELRRYRWNQTLHLRGAGRKVGRISGTALAMDTKEGGLPNVSRIGVDWSWEEAGVTTAAQGGSVNYNGCLYVNRELTVDPASGTTASPTQPVGKALVPKMQLNTVATGINAADAEVYSLHPMQELSDQDSIILRDATESHYLRLWRQAAASPRGTVWSEPMWLSAKRNSPPANPIALETFNINYQRSPYVNGIPNTPYAPVCVGGSNQCETACLAHAGTLSRTWKADAPDRMELKIDVASNLGNGFVGCPTHANSPTAVPSFAWTRPRATDDTNTDRIVDPIFGDRSLFRRLSGDVDNRYINMAVHPAHCHKASRISLCRFTLDYSNPFLVAADRYPLKLVRVSGHNFEFGQTPPVEWQISSIADSSAFPTRGRFVDDRFTDAQTHFGEGMYLYQLRDKNGLVLGESNSTYVKNPNVVLPPRCFRIVDGDQTNTRGVDCETHGDIVASSNVTNVSPGGLMTAVLRPSGGTFYDFEITEKVVIDGVESNTARCTDLPPNNNRPIVILPNVGAPQPFRHVFRACNTPGVYRFRIVTRREVSTDPAAQSDAFPLEGITIVVGNSAVAPVPINVVATADRAVQSGLGYKVNWQAGAWQAGNTPVPLVYKVRRAKLDTAVTGPATPPATGVVDQMTTNRNETNISGTVSGPGKYFFWVQACAADQITNCSGWSVPSAGLVLPAVVSTTEIPDDASAANYADYVSPQANSTTLAGATAGQASVEGGAASYSVPVQLPPGRHGMQPSVTLSYSSRAGNGDAGMGFSLSGSSSISRCPKTLAVDGVIGAVRFNGEDRLCLDGQRLITESGSAYGANGAKYRTEIESYIRVTQYGGSLDSDQQTYFIAEAKSGERMVFGASTTPTVANGYADRNTRVQPSGAPGNKVLSWLLNTRWDRSGNNVMYGYLKAGSGEHLLSSIVYTGRTDNTNPSVAGNREVLMTYEDRSDRSSSYLAGALSEQTKRLKTITTKAEGAEVRTYTLGYELSEYSGRSVLAALQECFAGNKCLPKQSFSFSSERAPTNNRRLDIGGISLAPTDPTGPGAAYLSDISDIGDLNGDGTVEIGFSERKTNVTAALATHIARVNAQSRTIATAGSSSSIFGPGKSYLSDLQADFNNDGIADVLLLTRANGALSVRFGQGSGNLGTEINSGTSIPDSYYTSIQAVDINDDARADLVVSYRGPTSRLALYLNTSPNANSLSFAAPIERALVGTGEAARVITHIADFDGDGATDVMTELETIIFTSGNLPSEINVFFGTRSGANYDVAQQPVALSNLVSYELPQRPISGNLLKRDGFRQLGDVNGDGLVDWISSLRNTAGGGFWTVRLNTGKRGVSLWGAEINTGNNRGMEICKAGSVESDGCTPRMAERFNYTDYDADGRMDVLVPRAFASRVCLWQHADHATFPLTPPLEGSNIYTRYLCPFDIYTASPADITQQFNQRDFYTPQNTEPQDCTQNGSPQLNDYCLRDIYGVKSAFGAYDPSAYYMDHIRFNMVGSGAITATVTATDAIQNGSHLRPAAELDLFGDGLADRVSILGYPFRSVLNQPNPQCAGQCNEFRLVVFGLYPLGKTRPPGATGPDPFPLTMPNGLGATMPADAVKSGPISYLSENRGAKVPNQTAPSSGDPIPPDTLMAVTNNNGMSYSWKYATLASNAGRGVDELPLYTVPARDSGAGYVDADHFYFASSMPVVASFFQSNGVGSSNETRYGYEEAMYNNKGRGFTGFRKIITEDLVNGLRNATIFEQKFPLISQAICSASQTLNNPLSDLNCTSKKAISATVPNVIRCNGQVCFSNDPSNPVSSKPLVAPIRVEVVATNAITRDLSTRNIVTSSAVTRVYDAHSNVTSEGSATVDFNGTAEDGSAATTIRSISAGTNAVFDVDTANWWINKVQRSTTTATQSYGSAHPGGPDVPTRTTTSQFYYHVSRQPSCELLFDGTAFSTATECAQASGFERMVARSFDGFGNVVGEATTARDASVRSIGTGYDAEGYFPTTVTDANLKSVVSEYDARFGVPISITDANGLVSTTTLDEMGRPIRTVAPKVGDLNAAMPATMAYERCGVLGVSCPIGAVTRVVSSQYGSAQKLVYVDSLGRTIRTATSLLTSGYHTTNAFNLSTMSVVDVFYNARGLMLEQYEPNFGTGNAGAVTSFAYDELGRSITKLQKFKRVDQDDLASVLSNSVNYRRTDYVHAGLTTRIKVCQVASENSVCAGTGNNADGSPQLSMSRSFDSAGKLISTVDANGKATKYWFDGVGNPLRILDVVGLQINATYNNFGHRLSVVDPDRGAWSFAYNGFGEVTNQTDARGLETTLVYDHLGRMTERRWNEPVRGSTGVGVNAFSEISEFDDASTSNYGTLKKVTRVGALGSNTDYEKWERSFTYDALSRATLSKTTMRVNQQPEVELMTETRFDRNYGRPKQMIYPTSSVDLSPVSTYALYNAVGMMIREGFANDFNAASPLMSPAIHTVSSMDGRGMVTSESYGVSGSSEDWRTNAVYDSSGWLLAQCVNRNGTCSSAVPGFADTGAPLDQRYRFDVYGNLKKQWHTGAWMPGSGMRGEESFSYDNLHRLVSATRNGANNVPVTTNYAYNDIGGLRKKSDYSNDVLDAYQYQPGTHKVTTVGLKTGGNASFTYDLNGNVVQRLESGTPTVISYDVNNLPRRITKGLNQSDFYEGQGGRYLQRLINGSSIRETYMLEKTYELEKVNGQPSIERYYLGSGSVLTIQGTSRRLNYLHTDRLGNIVSISEKPLANDGRLGVGTATLVEHKGFDAFGKALDGIWGTSNNGMLNLLGSTAFNQGKRNQRGFTGHEHLDEFALIHMNGRAYDYNLGRFFGVDPIIQFPANSQSLNPYGYLMNNPLAGTDPTGYSICNTGPKWACAQEQASEAYRSGYAYVSPAKALLAGIRSTEEGMRNGADDRLRKKWGQETSKIGSDSETNKTAEDSSGGSCGRAIFCAIAAAQFAAVSDEDQLHTRKGAFGETVDAVREGAEKIAEAGNEVSRHVDAATMAAVETGEITAKEAVLGVVTTGGVFWVAGKAYRRVTRGGRTYGVPLAPTVTKLNLGSGENRMAGAVNLDRTASRSIDVRATVGALPFRDGTFAEVHSVNPFGFQPVSSEVARVMQPGGLLYVTGNLSNKFATPLSPTAAQAAGFRIVETRSMIDAHRFGVQRSTQGRELNTTSSITTIYQRN